MTTRYLELDSTYRNRNLYPNPAEFVVDLSQSGTRDYLSAVDPVSDAAPILTWNNSFTETTTSNQVTALTVTSPATPENLGGPVIFKLTSGAGGELRAVDNFYNGCMLVSGTTARRIIDYEYLGTVGGNNTAIVTLDSALPDALVGTNAFIIANPTPIPTNTANAVIKFFIPGSLPADNYYVGYLIEAVNGGSLGANQQSFPITAFDGLTHLATINTNNVGTAQDWAAATSDINFAIRKVLPNKEGVIPNNPAIAVNGVYMQLPVDSIPQPEYYRNSFIRLIEPIPTAAGGYSVAVAPYGQEVKIIHYMAESGTIVAAAGNTFTLNAGASSLNNYYLNMFITVNTAPNQTYQITSYTGSTRSGTISAAWGVVPPAGTAWYIRTATLANAFSAAPVNPSAGQTYNFEIEQFSYDNSVPLTYTGSLVSVTEARCYEIELINLILPNTTLQSGHGGRAVFYPYFYCELQNVSSSSAGNRGVIWSNNPNANRMIARCVEDDTTSSTVSPFVKIDSGGMSISVKIKPTDSFKFSVRHANGELFRTVLPETYGPQPPNPLVQISAMFSMKISDSS